IEAPAKTQIKAAKPAKAAKPPKAEKPANPAPPPTTNKPANLIPDEEDRGAYGIAEDDEKLRCPQCAYIVEEDTVICISCGFNLRTREQNRTRKVKETTGGERFFWLLPGVLAVLGVILVLGYCCFHYFAWPGILVDGWEAIEEKHGGRIQAIKKEESIGFWAGALI